MGGGILNDGSHELDYVCWLLGKPNSVICRASKTSSLEINTEDNADVLLSFENDLTANIHLDFLRQDYTRNCEVVCEKATIVWRWEWKSDRARLEVRTFNPEHSEKISSEFVLNEEYDTNRMYLDEMQEFIQQIQNHQIQKNAKISAGATADQSMRIMEIVEKSLKSAKSGKRIVL